MIWAPVSVRRGPERRAKGPHDKGDAPLKQLPAASQIAPTRAKEEARRPLFSVRCSLTTLRSLREAKQPARELLSPGAAHRDNLALLRLAGAAEGAVPMSSLL